MLDHSGFYDIGWYLGRATNHGTITQDHPHAVFRVNAVQERDHRCVLSDQRLDQFAGFLNVIKFNAEHHNIDCSNSNRIIRRRDVR